MCLAGARGQAGLRRLATHPATDRIAHQYQADLEDCGVFISAAASVFEVGATGFWELPRHAKASVAAGQARDSIEARMSRIQQAVGGGPDVAVAAEFAAIAFARQGMMTNLGPLPFASQFGV